MEDAPRQDYLFVGAFTPREVKRVTDHLERLAVDYEVEFDESEIQDLPPAAVVHGFLGPAATVKLYVDPRKLLQFEAVIETLYPR